MSNSAVVDPNEVVVEKKKQKPNRPKRQPRYHVILWDDDEHSYDYVIRMSADELPPANAFWSLTLYDLDEGFFIPNERKKYSVGENAGFKLDADGGIEIHIAAEKPEGVPEENWLPIVRGDEALDIVMRLYAPDLEKMKIWTLPKAERDNN